MIIYYTDLQVGKYGLFDEPTESGYGLRLDNIIKCAEWISQIIIEKKPKYVINGGDNFDPIGMLDAESLSAGTKAISLINKACIEVEASHIMLLGNHDFTFVGGHASSVDHFHFLTDIEVVKLPKYLDTFSGRILLQPFSHDDKYTQDILNQAIADGVKLGFSHIDIKGFKFNPKAVSDFGVNPDIAMRLYNGHYHITQRRGSVYCPGSPLQHKYSEFSLTRQIVYLDENLKEHLIENTISPKMYKAKTLEELDILPDNSYIWLDYDPRTITDADVANVLKRFKKSMITKSIESYDTITASLKLQSKTEPEIFIEYVDKVMTTELDKEKLKTMGLKIVKNYM